MTSVQQLVTRLLEQKLSQYGFDLVHVFPVQLYNTRLAAAVSSTDFDRFKLPEWSQHSPSTTLGVLVGNTKSLWPAFIDNLAQDPSRLEQHPGRAIDSYTEEAITQCVGDALNESHDGHNVPQHRIWYSFRMSPGELLPFQRLVHSVGFAHLNRSANLCIHPKYGPWISFRSVIVIDCPGPALDDPSCQELDDPYPECAPLIREWFAAKLATAKWQDWVHLRDIAMPPHTKEHRYTEQQILYHYTKQEHILRDAIKQDTIAQKTEFASMTNSPTPAEARRLFRTAYRLAQRWPLDNLRPDQSFTTMVLARLRSDFRSTASTSANTSERYQFWTSELKALSTLQNNEAGTKYPVSERMMTPHADPEYYHRLLKLIDETIERQKGSTTRHGDGSFLGSFFSRVFGQR